LTGYQAAVLVARLLDTTVTVEPCTGASTYGDPTYGTAVVYPARVETVSDVVRGVNDEEIYTTHRVALLEAVPVHSRVTLAAREGSAVKRVARAEGGHSFGGDALFELRLA
jgi:hypothetical protein